MSKTKRTNIPMGSTLFPIADPLSPISEQFRTIRTNIQFSKVDKPIQSIVVTSTSSSEGKSTTSANLAVVFALSGAKTLLVDADLRRPTTHLTFSLDNTIGLSSLLSVRRMSVNDVAQATEIPNLTVMTSGSTPPNPSELLSSNRMAKMLSVLRQKYGYIIFDMPPVVTVTDAQIVASHVDGVVLTTKEGVTEKKLLLKAKELLDQVNANIIGSVYFSNSKQGDHSYYYHGYQW